MYPCEHNRDIEMKTKLATLTFLVTFVLANFEELGKVKEFKRLSDLSATNHDETV